MKFLDLNEIMKVAHSICEEEGVQLTENRKNILTLMIKENKSLSAYEIVNNFKSKFNKSLPAMSVYRLLDFWEKRKIIHKILNINKYVICTHIMCKHDHGIMNFISCYRCSKVEELILKSSVVSSLKENLDDIGFNLRSKSLEMIGLCSSCNK
jgi:Fur family transcriptional regulator, zinc uptake regulator